MGQVRRDAIINTVITYSGVGLGYLNKGLLFPILLLPEQVGLANVVMLIVGFFGQLSNLGTGMILMRFLPFMRGRDEGYSGILLFAIGLLLGGIGLVSLLLLIFNQPILGYFSDRSPLLIDYSFWIIPLGVSSAFFSLFEHYLRAISKNLVAVMLQDLVLRIAVFLSLIIFYMGWFTFDQFIIIFLSLHFIPGLLLFVYLIWLKRFYVSFSYLNIRKRLRTYMISYGLVVYFNSFGRNVILMADTLMLSAIAGLKEVGIFTTMVFLSNALFVPYVSLIRISAPLVPQYWKKRELKALASIYRKVSSTGYFVTFFLFSVVWFNIDLALSYLPKAYADGKAIFLLLMIGRMFDALGGLNGDILLTSKKYRIEIWLTLPLLFLVFILNSLLIPDFGGVGAAFVTCLIYAMYNLMRLSINLFYFRLWPFDNAFLKMFTLSIVMFFAGVLSLKMIDHYVLKLLLGILMPVIFFAFPVYLFRWVPDISLFMDQALAKLKKA